MRSPFTCFQYERHRCMIWLTLFKRWDLETGHLDQESIVLIRHPRLILNRHLNSKNPSHVHLSFNHKRSHSKRRSLLQIVGINMEGIKGEIMKNYKDKFERKKFSPRFLNFSTSQERSRNGRDWLCEMLLKRVLFSSESPSPFQP